jgi:hypothetical protein
MNKVSFRKIDVDGLTSSACSALVRSRWTLANYAWAP